MCVNDVLVSGAQPLFFLDYIACGRLQAGRIADIVAGVAEGCRQAGCALIGGETAEMPGFYPDGEYDIAGFAVGAVEHDAIVDGSRIAPGDVVIGLSSQGCTPTAIPGAQGAAGGGWLLLDDVPPGLRTASTGVLTPTRIYAKPVLALLREVDVLGMAHITGGGLVENPPRVLPEGTAIELNMGSWTRRPVFDLIREAGNVPMEEMVRVFNMGIGFVIIVKEADAARAIDLMERCGETAQIIGKVVEGHRNVSFRW